MLQMKKPFYESVLLFMRVKYHFLMYPNNAQIIFYPTAPFFIVFITLPILFEEWKRSQYFSLLELVN